MTLKWVIFGQKLHGVRHFLKMADLQGISCSYCTQSAHNQTVELKTATISEDWGKGPGRDLRTLVLAGGPTFSGLRSGTTRSRSPGSGVWGQDPYFSDSSYLIAKNLTPPIPDPPLKRVIFSKWKIAFLALCAGLWPFGHFCLLESTMAKRLFHNPDPCRKKTIFRA